MPRVIVDGLVVEDSWQVVREPGPKTLADLGEGKYLLPLTTWNTLQSSGQRLPENISFWIASTELPEQIEGNFLERPLIAIDFPVFVDGRGFSIARLLRERYGYKGQLRAIGRPIRDQLTYMVRCGFNAFQLADHYDPDAALASLHDFSESYQAAVDQKSPLFCRRN